MYIMQLVHLKNIDNKKMATQEDADKDNSRNK